jgi:hypothetical protein
MKHKKKNFIAGAIKHPGRMKRLAKKHGRSTHAEMEADKSKGGSLGRAANLGLTLLRMSKRGKRRSSR